LYVVCGCPVYILATCLYRFCTHFTFQRIAHVHHTWSYCAYCNAMIIRCRPWETFWCRNFTESTVHELQNFWETAIHTETLYVILNPCRRVLLGKLIGSQLLKNFPAFYGARRFITAFKTAHHLSLSWPSSIQSILPHPTSGRSILILPYHLPLGLSKWSFSFRVPHRTPVYTSTLPHTRYMSRPSHFSRFHHPNSIGWGIRVTKLLIM
jgi:hypothetical protein